ncbi:hypothetical protein G4228_003009 [Cervus hanglu yarkandensis]|nr:hypothetical protein G4228_003009 [Cervus hanglu yarkandensis]
MPGRAPPEAPCAALFLAVVLASLPTRPAQEPSSQGSQSVLQTRDPIFEEDTPSVMEIEMEELDKWMNSMNRNADYECLPTLEEEKEPNHNNPRYFSFLPWILCEWGRGGWRPQLRTFTHLLCAYKFYVTIFMGVHWCLVEKWKCELWKIEKYNVNILVILCL